MLKSIGLLVLILLRTVYCKFFYEADSRIIIVSGEIPQDGHLRLARSANARNLTPILLIAKEKQSEIRTISEYLNNIRFDDNEISVLTSSPNYLATNDASNLAMSVSRVALTRGGDVVMAFPMNRNLSSFETNADADIGRIKDILKHYRGYADEAMHLIPESMEEWREIYQIYAKYNKMLVKQNLYQYQKASIYDIRYCAFAGLTLALKQMFNKVTQEFGVKHGDGSLDDLCKSLALNTPLIYELNIVKDMEGHVFKRTAKSIEDIILMKEGKAKNEANHLMSSNYQYSPMTFGHHDEMPFLVANFASGDLILEPPLNDFFDNRIEDLEKYYGRSSNLPTVQIIIVHTHSGGNIAKLFECFSSLSYPKEKLIFDFLVQSDERENQMADLQRHINNFTQSFPSGVNLRAIIIDSRNIEDVYDKVWNLARELKSTYTLILHSSVLLTDSDVLTDLIKLNRNIVSPLLASSKYGSNFKADRSGKNLKNNMLTDVFESQYEDPESSQISGIGLQQVPYVFGALLIRIDALNDLDFYFNICPKHCDESDKDCLKDNCEDNFYENLESQEEGIWGMMIKNIQESGYITYISNQKIYGEFDPNFEMTSKDISKSQKEKEVNNNKGREIDDSVIEEKDEKKEKQRINQ